MRLVMCGILFGKSQNVNGFLYICTLIIPAMIPTAHLLSSHAANPPLAIFLAL